MCVVVLANLHTHRKRHRSRRSWLSWHSFGTAPSLWSRRCSFFEKKKEEAKKEKDKPKPKIVVKASAIKKKNGSSSKPKVVVNVKLAKKKSGDK